ncbi:membrane-bound serine protease (ClpP class) [Caloranaerobacter azorensis DSM 13643]|uniref:Membrane-bound serine protease (ClpP class) n=1 Tax=Caloranaerobacter azorensis DSM 13643 TaxID=1121264 RepID=A0A1M5S7I4_9FIRM|nr:NfeD family protein [Caloranaerobacter azorensis]SHH34557.1 membrane-bound serine protease (ClpP class) [Caloranaerobacter azorensis DSM 13643]
MKVRRVAVFFILLVLVLSSISVYSDEGNDVYVIPIKGEINKATYQFVKTKVEEISKYRPAAIIFEIDTYGGFIDNAIAIKDVIMEINTPTISFVNNKAESAGVLITIAGEKIVMAEGSTIGSAEPIPNTEKIMSMWVSTLKTVAEQRGRDKELVAAMADKDIEIDGVVKKGKLLNLNYKEAKQLGFADYISNDYDDILDHFDINYNKVVKINTDLKMNIAKYLTNPYVSVLLISLGFLGFVIELFTPGFGVGGTLSLISFSLYFGGNIIVGNSGWGTVIIFLAGIVLLLIEVIMPGFGVPGIGGIICVIISIVLTSGSIESAMISLGIAIILTVLVVILLVKYGQTSPYLDKIVLRTRQNNKKGYVGVENKPEYVGKEGIAISLLRPAGIIDIEGNRIDAVSEGSFIEKGAKVKVIKVEGPRVVVRKL